MRTLTEYCVQYKSEHTNLNMKSLCGMQIKFFYFEDESQKASKNFHVFPSIISFSLYSFTL